MPTRLFIALVVLIAFGAWDLYILWRDGGSTTRTVSWVVCKASEKRPAIAFLAGYLVSQVIGGELNTNAAALLTFVSGHMFASMRDVK